MACGPPIAATMSGRVMNGPTPTISSMLSTSALPLPSSRDRCGGGGAWSVGMLFLRSASCDPPPPAQRSVSDTRALTGRTIHSKFMHLRRAHLLPLAALLATTVYAQTDAANLLPASAPRIEATPLPENRGAAALYESLQHLDTTASLMMIVGHPDDEDGGMLTYESRGMGVRLPCSRSRAAKAGRTRCPQRTTMRWD